MIITGRVQVTVLYFKNEDLGVATVLASTTKQRVAQFETTDAFTKIGKEITLVSPKELNENQMGGKTAAELAQTLSQRIPDRHKKSLQHVYLIAPEAGLTQDKPSFAQDLSKAMAGLGFSKVQVHAIANPVNFAIQAMGMQIAGLEDTQYKPGTLRAFVWKDAHTELGILSTSDYRKEMQRQYYTFNEDGPKDSISAAASFAIHFLQSQDFKEGRHPNRRKKLLNKGIEAIQAAPASGIDEIIKSLQGNRTDDTIKNKSSFCTDIVARLEVLLRHELQPSSPSAPLTAQSSTASMMQSLHPAGPSSSGKINSIARNIIHSTSLLSHQAVETSRPEDSMRPVIHVAATEEPSDKVFHSGSHLDEFTESTLEIPSEADKGTEGIPQPVHESLDEAEELIDLDFLCQALTAYKAMRNNECWGFHYNILGMMSLIYYVTDALTGTDHFNSKSRDVKISATNKLLDLVSNNDELAEDFTESEERALGEGRLGNIVASYGGLDAIRAMWARPQLVPTPIQDPTLAF